MNEAVQMVRQTDRQTDRPPLLFSFACSEDHSLHHYSIRHHSCLHPGEERKGGREEGRERGRERGREEGGRKGECGQVDENNSTAQPLGKGN